MKNITKILNSFALRILRLVLALAVGLLAIFFFLQRDMIYYPIRSTQTELERQASDLDLTPWRNTEGQHIGWQTARQEATGNVLIFHGNAGHALHREGLVRILEETPTGATLNYFILEYPGYGSRDGKPSETAFLQAARQALATIEETSSAPIVLLGESLGTGVASLLAGENPDEIQGVILLTPFDSLVGAARHHYPWLPVTLIMRDRFDSLQNLPRFNGPVVFVVAEQDEVVPPELGKKLALAYPGPKLEILVPGSDHNGPIGLLRPEQWQSILAFAFGRPPQ